MPKLETRLSAMSSVLSAKETSQNILSNAELILNAVTEVSTVYCTFIMVLYYCTLLYFIVLYYCIVFLYKYFVAHLRIYIHLCV